MDIEVEGRADVRVPKKYAHGLVVAFALDASGGKTVTQAVEL